MLEYIRNAITRLLMDRLGRNLGNRIPSCYRHVRHVAVAMATALPSNGALNILQLWASGGRTREPILIKFGMQQQVGTTMTVAESNIQIFKIQNVGKYSKCHKMPTNGPNVTQLDRRTDRWTDTA